MISKGLFEQVRELCAEYGFDEQEMYDVLGTIIAREYAKQTKEPNSKVLFDTEKNEIKLVNYYTPVEEADLNPLDPSLITLAEAKKIKRTAHLGEEFTVPVNFSLKDFGINAVDHIRGQLNQKIVEMLRQQATDYFMAHQNEVIQGIVAKVETDYVVFDLGYGVNARVSKSELTKEEVKPGARVSLYITSVTVEERKGRDGKEIKNKNSKNALRVRVSRSDKNLIKGLFEKNIPEIKDGTIEIMGIGKIANSDRIKVCVKSNDPNVDPLGSCLGPKGARLKSIIECLNGEKIDLFEYSEDPKILIKNALAPADVFNVDINKELKKATVVVPNDHYTLAIGKAAENVKLAVNVTGWSIDIKNVEDAIKEGIDF